VVLNEAIELRNRRRWSLLAQGVLFELVQHSRSTWTALLEVLGLGEVAGGSTDSLRESSRLAFDVPALDAATGELLMDPQRRGEMQRVMRTQADHGAQIVANWAPVMVGAASYAGVLDRYVELVGRLQWLVDLLAHKEPAPDQDRLGRTLTRSSVATENADEISDDDIHPMLLLIVFLAAQLDYHFRERAFELVSSSWWGQRTQAIIQDAAAAHSDRQP
jgi:hypothetical protein